MKKSQIQQAIDKVNEEIDALMQVRQRLEDVSRDKPKRKPKTDKTPQQPSTRSLSETH